MDKITFNNLLLKTAFCCMASDGNIDNREIALIKSIFEKLPLLKHLNLQEEINLLVNEINTRGKEFLACYFDLLDKSNLTEKEELTLLDIAIQTIKADEQIKYAEIKFFKNIRHRLKISNYDILAVFPDIELYLEEDILTGSLLDKITKQYMEELSLPQFEIVNIDNVIINNKNDK